MIRLLIILTTLLALVPRGISAQDRPATECFCLSDSVGQTMRGCSYFRPQTFEHGIAFCEGAEDEDDAGVPMTPEWTVILDGQEGCSPCKTPTPPLELWMGILPRTPEVGLVLDVGEGTIGPYLAVLRSFAPATSLLLKIDTEVEDVP